MVGFSGRSLALLIGFVKIYGTVELWLFGLFVLTYLALTFIYYKEREQRIADKERFNYKWAHSFEHIAIWIYFYLLNLPKLNHELAWSLVTVYLLLTAIIPLLVGFFTNLYILVSWKRKLPCWFASELESHYMKKVHNNALSPKLYHYIQKPYNHRLAISMVKWHDIERMVDNTAINDSFDLAIGVLSGGAFITKYVAQVLGIDQIHYVHSRCWSQVSLMTTLMKTARYLSHGQVNMESIDIDKIDLTGKRILLIDDSVATGSTMKIIKKELESLNAREVKTFAIYCHENHLTDYYFRAGRVPFIWPWGFEVD